MGRSSELDQIRELNLDVNQKSVAALRKAYGRVPGTHLGEAELEKAIARTKHWRTSPYRLAVEQATTALMWRIVKSPTERVKAR